jgi:HlyD family type I secretion membrane fusion protein
MSNMKDKIINIRDAIVNSGYISDAKKLLFAKSASEAGYDKEINKELVKAIWPSVRFGLITLAVGFGLFVVWGGLAPLDQAAIAPGTIVLSGNHKTIQHREGGVIAAIHVQDGAEVLENQVLMELNDTDEKAQVQVLGSQLAYVLAVDARLKAEQEGLENIDFRKDLFDFNDSDIAKTITAQTNLFEVRRSVVAGKLSVLREKSAQFQEQIMGAEKQLVSTQSQMATVESELKTQKDLLSRGLALRPRLNELQRTTDELIGREAQLKSQIASLRQSIAEARLEGLNAETEFQQNVANEYKENHSQLLEIKEKYNAAKDRLGRTKIKSPVKGIVTDLQYHTVGGVVGQGQKIMDVIPQDDTLLVEAKVNPQDIDSIHLGLLARVQLGAFKAKLVPRINGKVVYVAADVVKDQHGQQPPFYLVRVELDQQEIKSLRAEIKLYPGMPASVFIVKGERTFLQYMISPIRDSFYKAFKET